MKKKKEIFLIILGWTLISAAAGLCLDAVVNNPPLASPVKSWVELERALNMAYHSLFMRVGAVVGFLGGCLYVGGIWFFTPIKEREESKK